MFEKLFAILCPVIVYSHELDSAMSNITTLIDNERALAVSEYRAGVEVERKDHDADIHELLVAICLLSDQVLYEVAATRKINAIKHLRGLVGHPTTSLKAAKLAVEDDRVLKASGYTDPELADHNSNYQQ